VWPPAGLAPTMERKLNLREYLNLLAPRLRRYARALVAGHPGPNDAADVLVSVALRRSFETGAVSPARELDILAFGFLIEASREQCGAPGARTSSFGSPVQRAMLGLNVVDGISRNGLFKTGGSCAADLHPPEKLASALESNDSLCSALWALKLEEREALLLVGLEGFSYAQAARILKISRPILVARLSRARERLPKKLKDRCSSRRANWRPTHLRVVK
jgi:RNA polymerase sigma-70 factor, ECF subfamily